MLRDEQDTVGVHEVTGGQVAENHLDVGRANREGTQFEPADATIAALDQTLALSDQN